MADIAGTGQVFMGQLCLPHSFTYPDLFGAKFTNIETNLVTNQSMEIPQGMYWSHHTTAISELSFCNVSVAYTHPGWNDNINVQVWLPSENWNGRLQGSGGGGLQTGLVPAAMLGAVGQGYAAVSTDGGHFEGALDGSWALSSPGNINWALVQDFSSVALNDAAVIAKAITKDFYGRAPSKSYWNGCSMGGRQGLQIAQRYPTAYDGILAAAPAINSPKFITAEFWPQMVMHEASEYPPGCVFEAITSAAISACDELDGVKDGIISSHELCNFDAKTLIGKEIDCAITGKKVKISEIAVKVAETAWEGARQPNGDFLWHGLNHDAPLTGAIGLANTACEEDACKVEAFPLPTQWIKFFLKRDPAFDVTTLKHQELVQLFHQAQQEFRSIIAADDPDLSAFHHAGGKMITWHGLADQVIMPNGSREYYDKVTKVDPDVKDYYRYFEAPGVPHCWGGPGPYPGTVFDTLVEWVERGKAPETLPGISVPDEEGRVYKRDLCAYPKKIKYKGAGDVRAAESFECV